MELHCQGLWFESEDVRPPLSHAETGNGDANHHESEEFPRLWRLAMFMEAECSLG